MGTDDEATLTLDEAIAELASLGLKDFLDDTRTQAILIDWLAGKPLELNRQLAQVAVRRLVPLVVRGVSAGIDRLGDRMLHRTAAWLDRHALPDFLGHLVAAVKRLKAERDAAGSFEAFVAVHAGRSELSGIGLLDPMQQLAVAQLEYSEEIRGFLARQYEPPLSGMARPERSDGLARYVFSTRQPTFCGRDTVRASLRAFLADEQPFLWHLVTGAVGAGKSRLALEVLSESAGHWSGGFVDLAALEDWNCRLWEPEVPTLLVLDDIPSSGPAGQGGGSSLIERIRGLLADLSGRDSDLKAPVRLLLLASSPAVPKALVSGLLPADEAIRASAWPAGSPDGTALGGLDDAALRALLAAAAGGTGDLAIDALVGRVRDLDPDCRPLFALLAAWAGEGQSANAATVLRHLFASLFRGPWSGTTEDDRLRAAAASIAGPIRLADPSLQDELKALCKGHDPARHAAFAGRTDGDAVLPMEPALFGELFALDEIRRLNLLRRADMLADCYFLAPARFGAFVTRAADDFPAEEVRATLMPRPPSRDDRARAWLFLYGEQLAREQLRAWRTGQQGEMSVDAFTEAGLAPARALLGGDDPWPEGLALVEAMFLVALMLPPGPGWFGAWMLLSDRASAQPGSGPLRDFFLQATARYINWFPVNSRNGVDLGKLLHVVETMIRVHGGGPADAVSDDWLASGLYEAAVLRNPGHLCNFGKYGEEDFDAAILQAATALFDRTGSAETFEDRWFCHRFGWSVVAARHAGEAQARLYEEAVAKAVGRFGPSSRHPDM
jgi:hypothetical protein